MDPIRALPPAPVAARSMREMVESAPQDSVLMQSSGLARATRGAVIGGAAGWAGATAGGWAAGLANTVLPARGLPFVAAHLPTLLQGGLLASLGLGVAVGAATLHRGTAGDHAPVLAVKNAARMAGRVQGAVAGALAGASVSPHPALALPAALAGAWAGSKVGAFAGGAAGNMAALLMKSRAGMEGSRFHQAGDAGPKPASLGPNRYTPIVDDDNFFRDVMAEVAQAKKSIHFETYLLNGQDGKALCDLLIQKAREGVEVKVLLDPFFQKFEARQKKDDPLYSLGAYLRDNGVECADYALGKLTGSLTPSEHAKILVIDDSLAYLGGSNIDDTYNHDVNVKVEGPAAADIDGFFQESWTVATHPDPEVLGLARDPVVRADDLTVHSTGPSRSTVKQAVLDNIRNASKSIHIEMFTLTDDDLVDELVKAKERGVDVKVLLCDNKEIFHLPTFHVPNLPTALKLRDAGVDVRWYANPKFTQMHSKLALFDGETVMVGSANWIHHAFRGIHEYYGEIDNAELAAKMEAQFADDWNKHGEPVDEPKLGYRVLGTAVEAVDGLIF